MKAAELIENVIEAGNDTSMMNKLKSKAKELGGSFKDVAAKASKKETSPAYVDFEFHYEGEDAFKEFVAYAKSIGGDLTTGSTHYGYSAMAFYK